MIDRMGADHVTPRGHEARGDRSGDSPGGSAEVDAAQAPEAETADADPSGIDRTVASQDIQRDAVLGNGESAPCQSCRIQRLGDQVLHLPGAPVVGIDRRGRIIQAGRQCIFEQVLHDLRRQVAEAQSPAFEGEDIVYQHRVTAQGKVVRPSASAVVLLLVREYLWGCIPFDVHEFLFAEELLSPMIVQCEDCGQPTNVVKRHEEVCFGGVPEREVPGEFLDREGSFRPSPQHGNLRRRKIGCSQRLKEAIACCRGGEGDLGEVRQVGAEITEHQGSIHRVTTVMPRMSHAALSIAKYFSRGM